MGKKAYNIDNIPVIVALCEAMVFKKQIFSADSSLDEDVIRAKQKIISWDMKTRSTAVISGPDAYYKLVRVADREASSTAYQEEVYIQSWTNVTNQKQKRCLFCYGGKFTALFTQL